ncbi:MAG: hypothetical protein GY926_01810 [bacterium]|nr:hypothetical protein [bacterium]
MSKTSDNETLIESAARPPMVLRSDAGLADIADQLMDQACNEGVALTGAGGPPVAASNRITGSSGPVTRRSNVDTSYT